MDKEKINYYNSRGLSVNIDLEFLFQKIDGLKKGNLKNLWKIPHKIKGIYFLMKDDELLYIGQSCHIQNRVYNHFLGNGIHRYQQKTLNNILYIEMKKSTKYERELFETFFIDMFCPKYNNGDWWQLKVIYMG